MKLLTVALLLVLASDLKSSASAPPDLAQTLVQTPFVQSVVRTIRTAKRAYQAYTAPPVALVDDELPLEQEEPAEQAQAE